MLSCLVCSVGKEGGLGTKKKRGGDIPFGRLWGTGGETAFPLMECHLRGGSESRKKGGNSVRKKAFGGGKGRKLSVVVEEKGGWRGAAGKGELRADGKKKKKSYYL